MVRVIILVVAGLWVFAPAWGGGWVWDDGGEVANNLAIRQPLGTIGQLWWAPAGFDYFPLKATVQWLEWHAWGDHPLGYHLVSVALHLASAGLLWRLFTRIGIRSAWWGALLFTVHPLMVESVAWISELKNTLSLPLLLLAMGSWLDFCEAQGAGLARAARRSYCAALIWFLAAMCAKSSVVMFPLCLLLYAWWKHRRVAAVDLLRTLPFFVVSLSLGLVTVWYQQHRAIAAEHLELGGWDSRLASAFAAIGFYAQKFVWPLRLMPIYPARTLLASGFLLGAVGVSIAAAVGGMMLERPNWARALSFGFGWLVLNLLPVIGFIPMSYLKISWVADHFTYVPLLGLIGLVAAAGDELQSAVSRRSFSGGWALAAAAGAIAVGLAAVSHGQAEIYCDDSTFWTFATGRNPDTWVPHNNLGLIALHESRLSDAVEEYRAALSKGADFPEIHTNLGAALARTGHVDQAVAEFAAVARLQPESFDAVLNFANALGQLGRYADAAQNYRRAIALRPSDPLAHAYLGFMLCQLGRAPEAIPELRTAIMLQPDRPEAHAYLGVALQAVGQPQEARTEAQRAEALRHRP